MKIDLRILKTKKSIYESLLELLEDRPFEEIKVSEICSKAMINRSTFYTHFDDKYALFASLIKDLKRSLKDMLKENHNCLSSKEYYMEMIKILMTHVEEKKKFYAPIMINNHNSIAKDMIYTALEEDIDERIKKENKSDIPSDFVSFFYLGAILNVGIEWIKNRCNYSKEEIIEYLDKLIPNDI